MDDEAIEQIASFLLWFNKRWWDSPREAAAALVMRLEEGGYRIVPSEVEQ